MEGADQTGAQPPVDWRLARRMAIGLAGLERPGGSAAPEPIDAASLTRACDWAAPMVIERTGLEPAAPIPSPELIEREEWIDVAMLSLRGASELLAASLARQQQQRTADGRGEARAGRLGPALRPVVAAAAAAEVAAPLGFIARRVMGQYDIALVGAPRPPRLVFVAPNLASAARELRVDRDDFVRWIALHEVTHAVQFGGVGWLAGHLSGLIGELISGTVDELGSAGAASVLSRIARDPRGTLAAALRGELVKALAGPRNAETFDRLQATMAVVEGHAEWTMDACWPGPELAGLRAAMDARRDRGGPAAVIARLLGLEQKLRQYRLGRAFCEAVAARGGPEALASVWRGPERLPTLAELEDADAWLARVEPLAATR